MKKFLAILVAFIIVCCLAGCGVHIASIELPESLTVNVGETVDAVATFAADKDGVAADKLAEAASKLELTWTSADESVATVDTNGVVTGVAGGETTITVATADGSMSASVKVSVKVPLEDIKIEDIELTTLDKDVEVEYTLVPENAMVESVEFSIADEAIVTAKDGKITAVTAGETELTLACGDITKTVVVKVLQAPVELSAEDVSVEVGKTATIEVDTGLAEGLEAEVGDKYTYKVSDEKIATVDENGVVTGVTVGETEVKVTNTLGQDCTVEVEVTEPVRAATSNSGGASGGRTQGQNNGSGSGSGAQAPSNPTTPAPFTPDPAPSTPSAPDPTPAPTPSIPAEPQHYHGNGTDAGTCPVCGRSYSPDVDPSTVPGYADGAGGE